MAKLIRELNFMIVVSLSSFQASMIHVNQDGRYMFRDESHVPIPLKEWSTHPTPNKFFNMAPDCCDKPVDQYNPLKISNETSKPGWKNNQWYYKSIPTVTPNLLIFSHRWRRRAMFNLNGLRRRSTKLNSRAKIANHCPQPRTQQGPCQEHYRNWR